MAASRPPSAAGLATTRHDPAMDDATAPLAPAARIDRLLWREPVIWLSSVRPDGAPHLVPIWFSWDGETILVASKPYARKVANIRFNPAVMIALGEAEADFDIGMLQGQADLLPTPAREALPTAHLTKYADRMAAIGLTPNEFLATYSQVIRIRPTRFLPWHGRTTPASATAPGDAIDARLREAIRRVASGLERRRGFVPLAG
jgi:PPOX class probable F420-dependent enzyme